MVEVKDWDEAPELDETWFAEARPMTEVLPKAAQRAFKTGRPKAENPKKQVTLRLDADLLDALKRTGPGWQTRANDALRSSLRSRLGLRPAAAAAKRPGRKARG